MANVKMKTEKWERMRSLYRRRIWRFCYDLLDCKIIDNKFHREETDKYDELRNSGRDRQTLWFWPREHLKTTIFTVGGNLQDIATNPDITILLLSATEKLVKNAVKAISDVVIYGEKFNYFFPEVRPQDPGKMTKSAYRFTVNRKSINLDPTIEAAGILGEITGSHFDKIDYDDVVTWKNCDSEEKRQKLKGKIDYTLSIMKREGKRIFKGTKYEEDDYYSLIFKSRDRAKQLERKGKKQKNKWFISFRQMREKGGTGEEYGTDPDGTRYIFPQKFNTEEEDILRDPHTGQEPHIFTAQYFNISVTSTLARFKAEDILEYKALPKAGYYFITCDSAGTTTGRSDRSAIMVCYWGPKTPDHPKGAIYTVRYLLGKYQNSQIAAYMFNWYVEFEPEMMSIEIPGGVASGLWDYMMEVAEDYVADVQSLNFVPFKPQAIKESKHERICNMEPYFKQHRWLIKEEHTQFKNRLVNYRGHKYGKDDLLDCASQQLKIGHFPDITIGKDGAPPDADKEEDQYEPMFPDTGY